jgi:hypothetical protein
MRIFGFVLIALAVLAAAGAVFMTFFAAGFTGFDPFAAHDTSSGDPLVGFGLFACVLFSPAIVLGGVGALLVALASRRQASAREP